jgi:ABC-type nitrate/sulfonate/bicarbonate transport system substrate-binding protein
MRTRLFLRTATFAIAILAATGLVIGPAAAQQPTPLRFISFGTPRTITMGLDLGNFEREGLALEAQSTQESEQQLQELLDQEWGIGRTNADNIVYWVEDRGADFFIFMVTEGTVNQQFYVRPEIQSFEDIRGKVLAVDASESGYATVLRRILLYNGLEIGRDYEFQTVGNTALRTAALIDGRVVGAMLGEASDAATAAGIHVLARGTDYAPVYPASSYVTTRRWAADHPQELLAFIRAVITTNEWLADVRNEEAAVSSIARTDRVNEARARQIYRSAREELAPDSSVANQVRTDAMQYVVDLRQEVGLMSQRTSPSRYVNAQWYELALRSLAMR